MSRVETLGTASYSDEEGSREMIWRSGQGLCLAVINLRQARGALEGAFGREARSSGEGSGCDFESQLHMEVI